jgi:hypothetical protein
MSKPYTPDQFESMLLAMGPFSLSEQRLIATVRDRDARLAAAEKVVEATDRVDTWAWAILAHEYGEHFHINDTDTSRWADKVRAFLAASTAFRSALALIKQP